MPASPSQSTGRKGLQGFYKTNPFAAVQKKCAGIARVRFNKEGINRLRARAWNT